MIDFLVTTWLTKNRISAFVGPYNDAIAVATEGHHCPYLVVDWIDFMPDNRFENVFCVSIPPFVLINAVSSLVESYRWKRIAVIYNEDIGTVSELDLSVSKTRAILYIIFTTLGHECPNLRWL